MSRVADKIERWFYTFLATPCLPKLDSQGGDGLHFFLNGIKKRPQKIFVNVEKEAWMKRWIGTQNFGHFKICKNFVMDGVKGKNKKNKRINLVFSRGLIMNERANVCNNKVSGNNKAQAVVSWGAND